MWKRTRYLYKSQNSVEMWAFNIFSLRFHHFCHLYISFYRDKDFKWKTSFHSYGNFDIQTFFRIFYGEYIIF